MGRSAHFKNGPHREPSDYVVNIGQIPDPARALPQLSPDPCTRALLPRSGAAAVEQPGSGSSRLRILADHRLTLFADHDCRSVGVARGYGWHHRGVDNAQPAQTPDSEPRVDDGHRILAHLAGSDRVMEVDPRIMYEVGQLALRAHTRTGHGFGRAVPRQWRCRENAP